MSIELIKKSVLSLIHDGIVFKNLPETTLNDLTNNLTAYDYKGLKVKLREIEMRKIYPTIKKLTENLFPAGSTNYYDSLRSSFIKEIKDIKKLESAIKQEEESFINGKAKTFNINDHLIDPSKINAKLFLELEKYINPLIYTNPGIENEIERSSDFDDQVNNEYEAISFDNNFSSLKLNNNGLNITYGFENASKFMSSIILGDDYFTNEKNVKINNVNALTFVSGNTTPSENRLALKYNNFP